MALRPVSLAVAFGLLAIQPPTALADQVVADDLIVQSNLCVGVACADGEMFAAGGGQIILKGINPVVQFRDNIGAARTWNLIGDSIGFDVVDVIAGTTPFSIAPDTPSNALKLRPAGVGIGTDSPAQKLHVRLDQNANTFSLVQNATNGLNAAAVIRTQADTALQNFQSHASSRTLVRWGVPLGGWNEFLSVVGNGLTMGTLGNARFILGTSATARMTFDGDSNVIDFAGGGQYDGNSFNDASSRALKQDIRPLGPDAARDALAGLEPVTFAYRDAPADPRVGFVAEDVPELVATSGRTTLSALEIVAVLTSVVQEQQRAIQEQRKLAETVAREQRRTLEAQQRAIAELTARLATLEARP
jgi:hypothetical protein